MYIIYIYIYVARIVQESCVECSTWIGSFNKSVKLSCCGYICFGALTHFFRPNNKIYIYKIYIYIYIYIYKQLNRDLLNESFHVCAEHCTIIRSISDTPDDCRVLCTYMKRFVE